MLNFLRKYQKYFLFVITGAIIISFCFFGTYSAMAPQEAVSDREIGRGVGGKPLMQRELAALTYLIETSPFNDGNQEKGGMPNLFNDGVVEKDFLSTGLGLILAKQYFEELKGDLDQRLKKIHSFRPYVHPKSSQISLEGVWARFTPGVLEHYRQLKNRSDQATLDTLYLMSKLYVDQSMVSSDVLKQILAMQQNQLGVAPDPMLAHYDLHLFGFKSMEDWFGPRFISMVGQFILNAAQIAEEKGYKVEIEEVRADLIQNICNGYQQISRNAQPTSEELDRYYHHKMRALGLDEPTLINTWKKVMLFRRLFEDGSASVLIDPLAYQQFDDFAKENVRVSLYQCPPSLQLADFRSLMKFQTYIEGVSPDSLRLRTDLRIPRQMASLEQIEKKAPELVEREVELEWSSVNKEDLCKAISVKETWEWEFADLNWEVLKKNFSEISSLKAEDKQTRLAALDRLDPTVRSKVDQFARLKMVEEQPMKIRLALESGDVNYATIGLKGKGTTFSIPGLKDSSELTLLLENASLKGEAPNAANDRLNFYSPNSEYFYRFQVVRRDQEKHILTFAKASSDGTLDRLLDKKLEDFYPDARRKDAKSFQKSDGQIKPFKEVKDQIGKVFFADLLKSIEDNYRAYFGFLPGTEGDLPLNFYSNARMLVFMKEASGALKSNPVDPMWVRSDKEESSLSSQWLLDTKQQLVERCTQLTFSKDEMFRLEPGAWSSVNIGERGQMAFYCVQEKGVSKTVPAKAVEQGHQILSFDAKRDMMLKVLQRIQQKNAIAFSSEVTEELR